MRGAVALTGAANRPLIVGGGPAGAAAAIMLARNGTPALLIERSRVAHDVVCGGFLGRDALAGLSRLGVDASALGARRITRLRLIAGKRSVEAALPFPAAGLSRQVLDAALLEAAGAAGTAIERGVTVREVTGGVARTDDGALLTGAALFLATGKHELRGKARPRAAGGDDPAVGLRARLEPNISLASMLADMIELHLFDHGYAGLLCQEDGSINLCLSVKRSRLGTGISSMLSGLAQDAPLLADRIAAGGTAPIWQAIAGVPYGWRAQAGEAGLYRLGDQAAVIASLAGDGVAIALASGRMAAEHFARGGAAGALAFQHDFACYAAPPLRWAGTLRAIGEGPLRALLPLFAQVPGIAAFFAERTRIDR